MKTESVDRKERSRAENVRVTLRRSLSLSLRYSCHNYSPKSQTVIKHLTDS